MEKKSPAAQQRQPQRVPHATCTFRPINALGPYHLNLFRELRDTFGQYGREKELLSQCRQSRRLNQESIDGIICDRDRAATKGTAEFSEAEDVWDDLFEEAQSARESLDVKHATLTADLKLTKEKLNSNWLKIYKHFQELFNHCLDEDFEPYWSLSEKECISLRGALDKHTLLKASKKEAHELRYRRMTAVELSDEEKTALEDRVSKLEDIIELAQESQEEWQERFIASLDEYLIDVERRRASLNENIDSDKNPRPQGRRQSSDSEESRSVNESQQDEPGDDAEGEDILEAATAQYLRARDKLESFQAMYAELCRSFASRRIDHLLTFTNSSPERFDNRTESFLAPGRDDLRKAEADWMAARERLLNLGADIPRTPEQLEDPPTGGGLGIYQSPGSEGRRRRRINRTRAEVVTSASPEMNPSSPDDRSLGAIKEHDRSRRASGSLPSSVGSKRKLRKYQREQERRAEEFKKRKV